eukprot:TRINITY_DN12641_c0_g1_i1.p1 TRINITY_DN12641_c0_g1~~TRINITY_DN12641_c0_g1_i1.p1  ORF type:complete len:1285 (+),score=248.16 TRINITY_DN12641_c0_g1_i1:388-3855(+)
MKAVEANRIVMVTGATGSGKSTQVPQFVFDRENSSFQRKPVLVAMTRRIATTSVAARVALERGELLGKSVGFTISGCNASTKKTNIHFVTTGVLLAMLTSGDALRRYSCLILDEVHERTLDIDISLSIVKKVMAKRNTRIKLVIMSATMGSFRRDLQEYLRAYNDQPIPIISTSVSTNYVVNYIEDIDLSPELHKKSAEELESLRRTVIRKPRRTRLTLERLEYASMLVTELHLNILQPNSNILIFLPGLGDITDLFGRLQQTINDDTAQLLCLHSTVSVEEQNRIFHEHGGKRMIVLSTNIAESALTVKDLGVVIDFGLHKETSHSQATNTTSLELRWISKAMAVQRAGRCGRSFSGTVYRMISKHEYELLDDASEPEILSASLQSTCLKVLNMRWLPSCNVLAFLSELITPPSSEAATIAALDDLTSLKCIEATKKEGETTYHQITYLGKMSCLFPVDVHSALLIINGYLSGCFDDCLVIAASLSRGRSVVIHPFRQPVMGGMLSLAYAGPCISDEIMTVNAYQFWHHRRDPSMTIDEERDWCLSKGLSLPALREVHDCVLQYRICASKIGMCEAPLHAERGRKMEDKLRSIELLAASDVDETASLSLAVDPSLVKSSGEVTKLLFAEMTLGAGERTDSKASEKAVKRQKELRKLESAYTASDALLMSWLLDDAIRETELYHQAASHQFTVTCSLIQSFLNYSFSVGHAQFEGRLPVSEVKKGDIRSFYVDIELSQPVSCTPSEKRMFGSTTQPANVDVLRKRIEDQIVNIRDAYGSGSTPSRKLKGEPTIPVRSLVFRPEIKKVEMYLRSSAVGKDTSEGWFCQAHLHKTYILRIASRLLDRKITIPKEFKVKNPIQKATRSRDGKLQLPGKRAHQNLLSNVVAVSKVALHEDIAAAALYHFKKGKRKFVAPRPTSICFPLLLPNKQHVGIGVGTRMSGGKRLRLDSGTILITCEGGPELIALLVDSSVDISTVDVGDTQSTLTYNTTRNNARKRITVTLQNDLIRHIANVREASCQKMASLYESYVRHIKDLHAKSRAKNDKIPEFDESRLVPNTLANPLVEFSNIELANKGSDTNDVDMSPEPEPEPEQGNDGGVVTLPNNIAINNDDEELSQVQRHAFDQLRIACEPDSINSIALPNRFQTLASLQSVS